MAYSVDFRKKAIEYWEKGCTKDELREVFGICPARIYEWIKHGEKTGVLKPQYPKTRKRKIDLEKLGGILKQKWKYIQNSQNAHKIGVFHILPIF